MSEKNLYVWLRMFISEYNYIAHTVRLRGFFFKQW